MTAIDVRCEGDRTAGWTCAVTVRQGERVVSSHAVRVSAADLERLDPIAAEPTPLVEASFAFLLEREPPSSILRAFDLPVIGRYFPDFEATMRASRGR
jgi:hypothetical protein